MSKEKPKVFVITPFNEDFLALYEELKKHFENDFDFNNAGDLDNQQNILKDIVLGINDADIIIADVTGLNSNVFYELGIAHAMGKKVIIITQDIGELPFDIKAYRANEYGLKFNEVPALKEELRKLLNGAIDGSIKYSNPVSDFLLNIDQTTNKSKEQKQKLEVDTIIEEKGLLDFISEIQEDGTTLTNELFAMSDGLNEISKDIDSTSNEINRVKSNGNSLNPSFIRNVCHKLAIPLESFSIKVKEHSFNISIYWERIENNYLSLLDNKFMQTKKNAEDLKAANIRLGKMQEGIKNSNNKIIYFITSLKSTMGLERKLNKAMTSLINGLEDYLKETDKMHSSIDRIISKSNLFINKIEET